MLKQLSVNSLSLMLPFVLIGCSAFQSRTQMIQVNCDVPDATILVNGTMYRSPAQIEVNRNNDISITAQKEGYQTYQKTIGNHFNTIGTLDALGTFFFLVPAIGLFTPGAWSINETDVNIQLFKITNNNTNIGSSKTLDLTAELISLKELRDSGILTEDEFQTKKKSLLK